MIQEIVDGFISKEADIKNELSKKQWKEYEDLFRFTMNFIKCKSFKPDLKNIHKIDDGDYQGTILFLVPSDSYQPSSYLVTSVWYGSCSGCDALQGIHEYYDSIPTPAQVNDYYALCLHMVQRMKFLDLYDREFP